MSDQPNAVEGLSGDIALRRLLIALFTISSLGMGCWLWMQHNRAFLPLPDSKSGRALLRQYQELTHDIWLILLLLAVGYLINRIYVSRQREAYKSDRTFPHPVKSCLRFFRNNPITTVLLIAYIMAMISGTTYLYKDMFGWYPDLVKGYFLDNFSVRDSFISETMRRTDYRFFPLAHQDLHILSWFSIHIKTWMLFSGAELIGIILLSVKFLNNLEERSSAKASTILLMTSLLLIHPSTGTAFFHVIYCERLLCLIFVLYINAYLIHIKTGSDSSFYTTLLWALIGIYIKDIAILLFIIPPASIWAREIFRIQPKDEQREPIRAPIERNKKLEYWLCSLSLLFITSYIVLALIPSSYASEGAYNENAAYNIFLDLRFYIFALIAIYRAIGITNKKTQFHLLDAINLSGFAYAFALAATYEFDASSYLALPFQLIAAINIAWAWTLLIERYRDQSAREREKIIGAILTSIAVILADHRIARDTFINNTIEQKFEQSYIQLTYEKLDKTSREIRESGDDVNIIVNKKSRFSVKRHLNRIPYSSLIEYMPNENQFIIKDGAHKGSIYIPKVGDLIANLDKNISLIEPILKNLETDLIYQHNPSERTGIIRRVTAIRN
ncbi:hypothetical protein BL107_05704 [Synechococcus sp. BL107]|uniref:hypothetical protein n=1 Tax=Synechococcus sp. BL107 TaxID=313625 RepID=UPI0000E53BAB|nr:hypothetical protein [Synechococcus sp. BL107]EAU71000.1 hypothetical protein BL107_05704 [Synechococcus sp. BL107]